MGEVVLRSMRGSGAWSDGGDDPLLCGRPARHLGLPESCRFCDASVGTCDTPCLSAPSFRSAYPVVEQVRILSHRNLHRHGAAIPGSLILHLFSDLTRPAPYYFSLVRFLPGGPLLAVGRCEWQWFTLYVDECYT